MLFASMRRANLVLRVLIASPQDYYSSTGRLLVGRSGLDSSRGCREGLASGSRHSREIAAASGRPDGGNGLYGDRLSEGR